MSKVSLDDALSLAIPGRTLPLDDEGNMSAQGVEKTIGAIKTLAKAYTDAKFVIALAQKWDVHLGMCEAPTFLDEKAHCTCGLIKFQEEVENFTLEEIRGKRVNGNVQTM